LFAYALPLSVPLPEAARSPGKSFVVDGPPTARRSREPGAMWRPRQWLADVGIRLKRQRIGWQGAACPECARTKRRPGDDALGVELFADGGARWSCQRCGWKGSIRGERLNERRPPPRPPATEDRRTDPAAAWRLWEWSRPILPGTPAASYLEARGCARPHPDGDLRWLPDRKHPSGWRGPCLLARVTDAGMGEPMTLHRTWIQPDGTKAPVDKPRLQWRGLPKLGGVVRLWPDDEVTLGLCVAEGIETALTAAAGFGLAWATVDAGNLKVLPVLGGIECLTIIADHDDAGLAAAEECGRRWLAAGCEVRIWTAPTKGADLNDYRRAAA
jgi:hypothetical protein